MKKTLTILCSFAISAAAINVYAQNGVAAGQGGPGPQGMGPGPRGPMPLMVLLDANQDRSLDATEIASVSTKLNELDKDGDGAVTFEEVIVGRPPPPQGPPADGQRPPMGKGKGKTKGKGPGPGGHPPMLLGLFDTERDGTISAQEISGAPGVLTALDKNGDSVLTPDELRPPRPAPPQAGQEPPQQ